MKGRIDNRLRLEHILDAISEVERYVAEQDYAQFLDNSMMRYACIKQIEIIGEACNHLSESLRQAHPAVEWRKIIALRHLLVHEYFGVDVALVWDIVTEALPQLKLQIQGALDTLP